jgi:hypothetical protein
MQRSIHPIPLPTKTSTSRTPGTVWAHQRQAGLVEARKDFSRNMEVDGLLLARSKPATAPCWRTCANRRLLRKDSHSFDGLRFSGNIALLEKDRVPRSSDSRKPTMRNNGSRAGAYIG